MFPIHHRGCRIIMGRVMHMHDDELRMMTEVADHEKTVRIFVNC
jgi:hypothetical protein